MTPARGLLALAAVTVALLACGSAAADPFRVLVSVSHARGNAGEAPLHHATEDADHVRDVLGALGGVLPGATIRLVDPTAAQLQAALDRARGLAAAHAPADVTFFLYFSGHGDRDTLHLGGEAIAVSALVDRARAIPAGLRVVVTGHAAEILSVPYRVASIALFVRAPLAHALPPRGRHLATPTRATDPRT